jgi:hypothetical protein
MPATDYADMLTIFSGPPDDLLYFRFTPGIAYLPGLPTETSGPVLHGFDLLFMGDQLIRFTKLWVSVKRKNAKSR